METFAEAKRVVSTVATRSMAPLGLGRAQISLLRELGRSAPATQRALSHATTLDPSAAARSLTMLARRGWIRRWRGERDRRESYVELTARGRQLVARVEARYAAVADILGSRLDDRDATDLERICAKLSPLAELKTRQPAVRSLPAIRAARRAAGRSRSAAGRRS